MFPPKFAAKISNIFSGPNGLFSGPAGLFSGRPSAGNKKLRIIESNGRIAVANSPTSANRIRCAFRLPYLIGDDASDVSLIFYNYFLGITAITNIANSFYVACASIESPTGQTKPFYFNGNRNVTVAGGAQRVEADKMSPPTPYAKLTRGETWWIKCVMYVTTNGDAYPRCPERQSTSITNAQYFSYDSSVTTLTGSGGTVSGDINATDAAGVYGFSGTAGTNMGQGFVPLLCGTPIGNSKAVLQIGDSIANGNPQDTTTNSVYGIGFATRAASNGGTNPIPMLNISRSTSRLDLLINNTQWKALADLAPNLSDEYGLNSLYRAGSSGVGGDGTAGESPAQLQTKLLAMYSDLKTNYGYEKIIRHGLFAFIQTATDNYTTATAITQVPYGNYGSGGYIDQMNTWGLARVADGTINYFVEHSEISDLALGGNRYAWKVDNVTPFYSTPDGAHLNALGATLAANKFRTEALDLL